MVFLLIMLISYFVVAIIRKTKVPNECLPLIAGCLGLLLSGVAFYALPEIVPDPSIGTTLLYGFISGLAATGSNQVLKQAVKFINDKYGLNIVLPSINTEHSKGDK